MYQEQQLFPRDEVLPVKIEPERTGWAALFDLYRDYDNERIDDVNEDMDALLVFVRAINSSKGN